MWATTLYGQSVPAVQWGAVIGASLAAAVIDARSRRIPNWLTGALLLGGLAHAGIVGGGTGLLDATAACLVLALPYVLLFALAGGGAGDAKLMGAIGAWLGLVYGTATLVAVCLAGVVLGLLYAASARRLGAVGASIRNVGRAVVYPLFGAGSLRDLPQLMPDTKGVQTMPYGVAILAGVIAAATGAYFWPA
ncbi:MAG TPA: prepilin peptidase [Planctomycetota bacterium]|nr:prepilin peptidase [Planctomycetota bacterium]